MKRLILAIALACVASFAQTTTPASTPCSSTGNTPYSYFAASGIGEGQFSNLPAVTTGFGVKTGACSNAFLVTAITTAVGSSTANPGYGILSEHFEYHLAHTGYWDFLGDGQLGVVQTGTSTNGTVTTATFGGGMGVSFDVGYWLSKKSFHLPVVIHADYVAAPNAPAGVNGVKPSYLLDLRKTFGQ